MQTFLPYPDFIKSAKALDYKRLNKQRSECKQMLDAIFNGNNWKYHPAVIMWKGYEFALCKYMNVIINEWINRNYKNNMLVPIVNDIDLPPWFGDDRFHSSHRSNLLRKDYKWYSQFNWNEDKYQDYFWPTKNGY